MLINKWLVTDKIPPTWSNNRVGLSLDFTVQPINLDEIYNSIRKQSADLPFSISIAAQDIADQTTNEEYIDSIIGFFFLPSYCKINYLPVIFLSGQKSSDVDQFLARIDEKCKKQGFQGVLALQACEAEHSAEANPSFVFWLNNSDFDYDWVMKEWLAFSVAGKDPGEIHILIQRKEGSDEILQYLEQQEERLIHTDDFVIAQILYQKQRLVNKYKHELLLKEISEKNNRLYLSIQKQERENGLRWYYYEYEILPLWYKRVGHMIKVLQGKRSFRSLFNDDVKKYKD